MFNPEKAIALWRGELHDSNISHVDIDELESHLRDSIDELTAMSLSAEEAFVTARYRLGNGSSLFAEFSKLHRCNSPFLPLVHLGADGSPDAWVYAGFSRRLMAGIFDMCILILTGFFMVSAASWLNPPWSTVTLLALNVLFIAYVVSFTYLHGGTFGKILAGIRICRPDGSALSAGQALRRSVPYLLLALFGVINLLNGLSPGTPAIFVVSIVAVLLASFIWMLVSAISLIRNEHSRTLHDYFADTVVVDENYASINNRPPAPHPPVFTVQA